MQVILSVSISKSVMPCRSQHSAMGRLVSASTGDVKMRRRTRGLLYDFAAEQRRLSSKRFFAICRYLRVLFDADNLIPTRNIRQSFHCQNHLSKRAFAVGLRVLSGRINFAR